MVHFMFDKYKLKQLKNCRNGRIKKYTLNKSGRDNNRQGAFYVLFSSNRVCTKERVGYASNLLLSLPLCNGLRICTHPGHLYICTKSTNSMIQ